MALFLALALVAVWMSGPTQSTAKEIIQSNDYALADLVRSCTSRHKETNLVVDVPNPEEVINLYGNALKNHEHEIVFAWGTGNGDDQTDATISDVEINHSFLKFFYDWHGEVVDLKPVSTGFSQPSILFLGAWRQENGQ